MAEARAAPASRSAIKALKRTPLLYQIQEEIKSYIIRNRLKPGDALPSEGELARQLSTGRNSVREAVKSLEGLGIIEARSGSGLFVKAFTFDAIIDNLPYGLLFDVKSVTDILEIRAHLEYGMVDRVAREATDEQLDALHRILDRMRLSAVDGVYSADDDRSFHEALYRNIQNPVLSRVLDIFWLVVLRARELSQVIDPADPLETVKSHERILEALEARDLEKMRAAFDYHYGRWTLRLRGDAS